MVLRAQTELDGPLQHNTVRESPLDTIEVEMTTQKSSLGTLFQNLSFFPTILTKYFKISSQVEKSSDVL